MQHRGGGMEFCYGDFGTSSIDSSLEILKNKLNEANEEILNLVKSKEKKDE
jgi:hypothetical protein